MKEFRLLAWPELRAPFDRIAHRRMLSDMSHRYMSFAQLTKCSGARRHEVRTFVETLQSRHLIHEREALTTDSRFGSLKPFGGWLRRAMAAGSANR